MTSTDGTVIHQSSSRYNAEVVSYDVIPAFDDNVFEPNEKLTISGVKVQNTGGLPLPLGSTVLMPSTADLKFEQLSHKIPWELQPGETYEIPVNFHGRICDIPPPNKPQVYKKSVKFHPTIELRGRRFEKSFTSEISVQYPVQLKKLLLPEQLKRGEISTVSISIENVSTVTYGRSHGSVFLNLHMDSRLRPLGAMSKSTPAPYEITHDPTVCDSTYVKVMLIPPKKTLCVKLAIQMDENANLSKDCFFQVDLYFQKKLIQYKQKSIKTSVDVKYI